MRVGPAAGDSIFTMSPGLSASRAEVGFLVGDHDGIAAAAHVRALVLDAPEPQTDRPHRIDGHDDETVFLEPRSRARR